MRECALIAAVAVLASACAKLEPESTVADVATADARSQPRAEDSETKASGVDKPPTEAVTMHRWAMRMRPKQMVRIVNHHGDIRLKNSADSGLSYAGAVQKLNGEQRDPEFGTNKFAGGLALVVTAPEDWGGRVDAGVRVPKDALLELESTTGSIEMRLNSNPVTASTNSGQLALRTGGPIFGTSDSGRIRATFENTQYDAEAGGLESITGDIEVWVRPDAALRIIASANNVVNNISAEVGKSAKDADGATLVELGNNGASLRVATQTGTITLNVYPIAVQK